MIAQLADVTRHPYRRLPEELRVGDRFYKSASLPFTIQQQQSHNWCWAAVTSSVSHYYWSGSDWEQCGIATAEFDGAQPPVTHDNCCQSPVPGSCELPWWLDKALKRTDNLAVGHIGGPVTGPVDFDTIRNEIDAGFPVGARIGWAGGGGHFVTIFGYATFDGTEYFEVGDPGDGSTTQVPVSQFSTSYHGSGTWTNTYFTKAAAKMIKIKPISLDEGVIRCIWEARPILQLKYDNLREIKSPRDLSLAFPHYIYTMGLDALTQEQELPQQPTALRVLEMQNEKILAFFDISTKQPSPQIRQIGTTPYVDLFNRGLSAARQRITESDAEAELRLLQVPALHFEALWLHYDDSAKDVFIPLREREALTAFKVYPVNDFLAELVKIAKAQPPVGDMMGT